MFGRWWGVDCAVGRRHIGIRSFGSGTKRICLELRSGAQRIRLERRLGLGRRGRTGDDQLVAHHDRRTRQDRFPGDRRRLHGGASERQIKITVLENEAFKTKLSATTPDAIPDLFQSWGGGTMAAQADAGLLKDITADIASWKDTINPGALGIYSYNGKQYGVPWDMGMIGFWYNKKAFTDAGITAAPATWDAYLDAVKKLKASGIAPLAIAGKDKWPSMHLWTYLVLRTAGGQALSEMIKSGKWTTDACTKAGQAVVALNALDPYQPGYKSAVYNDEAASVGNGKAAMELMGQWAPSVAEGPERRQEGPRR